MAKIIDPTIEAFPMFVNIDPESVSNGDYMKFMGQFVPLISFEADNILWSKISSFELSVGLYNVPKLTMIVDDSDMMIQSYLNNYLNTGICRIGYNDFRMQFSVLYTNIDVLPKKRLQIEGMLWNQKLYDTRGQLSYLDKNITDIIKDACEFTGMGLYTHDNPDISTQIPHVICCGESPFEMITKLINDRTNNFWLCDPYNFFHVGDYDTMITQETSTYTLNINSGEQYDEAKPIIFKQNFLFGKELDAEGTSEEQEEKDKYKLPITKYKTESNYSDIYLKSKLMYDEFTDESFVELNQKHFGIGSQSTNTFSGFKSHIRAFSEKIRRKTIPNQVVTIYTNYILPELNPFSVVELELYNNPGYRTNNRTESEYPSYDAENSGKKVVIGYNIRYTKKKEGSEDRQLFEQEIFCI